MVVLCCLALFIVSPFFNPVHVQCTGVLNRLVIILLCVAVIYRMSANM